MIQAVLHDLRPGSPTRGVTQTVILGDHQPQILFIPRGVAHGYRVLGETSALVVYATSEVYNPDDELRLAHDDPQIGFDWTTHPR
jgi:dTDP-4-dehydrorhamnose 3,5-epimerase